MRIFFRQIKVFGQKSNTGSVFFQETHCISYPQGKTHFEIKKEKSLIHSLKTHIIKVTYLKCFILQGKIFAV